MRAKTTKSYLLTVVGHVTKQLFMCPLADKQADTVKRALVRLLRPYKALVRTITADNGTAFAQHAWFGKRLRAAVYFADPLSSWQRGLNEHTNSRVREYFPKSTCLADLQPSEIRTVQDRINARPRKVLEYHTSVEVLDAACAAA